MNITKKDRAILEEAFEGIHEWQVEHHKTHFWDLIWKLSLTLTTGLLVFRSVF